MKKQRNLAEKVGVFTAKLGAISMLASAGYMVYGLATSNLGIYRNVLNRHSQTVEDVDNLEERYKFEGISHHELLQARDVGGDELEELVQSNIESAEGINDAYISRVELKFAIEDLEEYKEARRSIDRRNSYIDYGSNGLFISILVALAGAITASLGTIETLKKKRLKIS